MKLTRSVSSSGCALCLVLLAVLGCVNNSNRSSPSTPQPKSLTAEHRQAISTALKAEGLPIPSSLEITDAGWLVATYQIRSGGGARSLAERSVLAIREAMLPYKMIDAYRVTVNGPSPGTGLIRRYGSARFMDRMEWEEGIR